MALLCASLGSGQRISRRAAAGAPATSPNLGAHKGLVVTLHGSLRKLTKKEMLIETDEHQLETIRLNKATKYLEGGKEVKRYDIDLDSVVTANVSQDVDLKFVAVSVSVDSPPAKLAK